MTGTGAAPAPRTAVGGRLSEGWRHWVLFALAVLLLLVAAPVTLSAFRLSLLAKYLCYAIVGVGICLAWGRGGMLTLGQGVFFGLGGYAMGMYLKLHEAGAGALPDFMVWSGVESLPAIWKPFQYGWVALLATVLLPVVLATLLGLLVFRQRVRGAYFAILSQALAAAFVILLIGQQGLTGGTNGLTNFSQFFGQSLNEPGTQRRLYLLVAAVLGLVYLLARQIVRSRFGELLVAVRDGEDRVRFLGYNPATVKTLTFAVSAGMAGLAGALFVPVAGIISPALLGVVPSIELLIGVAVGGRASLAGAILGVVLVNYARTTFSEHWPDGWLYLQGALLIAVITLAPKGITGLSRQVGDLRSRRRVRRQPGEPLPGEPARAEELV